MRMAILAAAVALGLAACATGETEVRVSSRVTTTVEVGGR